MLTLHHAIGLLAAHARDFDVPEPAALLRTDVALRSGDRRSSPLTGKQAGITYLNIQEPRRRRGCGRDGFFGEASVGASGPGRIAGGWRSPASAARTRSGLSR
jgi:hypothetical protein